MKMDATFMSDRTERQTNDRNAPIETLRRFLHGLLAIGVIGTGVELLLLGHTEDRMQIVPLALLGVSALTLPVLAVRPRPGLVRWFRFLMMLVAGSGAVGVYLHYGANAEFELEMYPSLRGTELMWESLQGAIPALAPGTMALLGLLGLISTYRHQQANRVPTKCAHPARPGPPMPRLRRAAPKLAKTSMHSKES
jgi:hypothetical protein